MGDAATMPTRSRRILFVATICAGSFLLFLVQPMIARMALPRLGGAPAVWNSAMLVYQALLLGGYAYAHWLGRFAPRRQSHIHIALFAVAALMLPIGLRGGDWAAALDPIVGVPLLLLASIGPLFFVVSAQAPLIQRWFAQSGQGDPYPLYAASNVGSFAGLLSYPLIVEPLLPVAMQSLGWSLGYVLLAGLVIACAARLPRAAEPGESDARSPAIAGGEMLRWIILAAIPSGLMLSTTLHLTTDIVAMPLLWVLPLGLYLLSFSIGFASNRTAATVLTRFAPFSLLAAGCGVFADSTDWDLLILGVATVNLFVVSVALHGAMFDRRPAPDRLTAFYLAMSIGGAAGGLFCALIAPLIFDWTYEYPILMVAAALAIVPRAIFARAARLWRRAGSATIIVVALLLIAISLTGQGFFGLPQSKQQSMIAALILIGVALSAMSHRLVFAAALMALMLSMGGWGKLRLSAVEGAMTRSFFGIYSLRERPGARVLVHGTTIHGVQNRGSAERERMPTSYYAPESGVGLVMSRASALFGPGARIGAVGLGAGTLACYAQPGQRWRFYEIDPVVEDIARDARRFTFLSRCLPDAKIAIGDARLVLATEPAASRDILIVDAFSSDSVPMHLLTREAFAIYARIVGEEGLVLVHISNRFLDLERVVAGSAPGWSIQRRDYRPDQAQAKASATASDWIAMSRSPATIARMLAATGPKNWRTVSPYPGFTPWTDDHASILPIVKW